MKLLAKRGMKREAISLNPRDNSDPDFNQDIKKADAFFHREQKRLADYKAENPDYDDGMPSITLNSPEEVQAFFEANPHLKEQNPALQKQLEEQRQQKALEQTEEAGEEEDSLASGDLDDYEGDEEEGDEEEYEED